MLNKVPLLVMMVVIVFLVVSLLSFIAMDKFITNEEVEVKEGDNINEIGVKEPPKIAQAAVIINIVKPNEG